ncbi:MAG: DUF3120 domain-containing protein [Synechococcus sp. MED-G71]|jgi:hypothetical protein|nr:MAG: DUF3120 domain-containing protein [Synechococcus sp. MED-G71]|tara:strand:+ start:1763 stop:2461 length:699 start_codon:yes stop_codon:yes gene_type:complete
MQGLLGATPVLTSAPAVFNPRLRAAVSAPLLAAALVILPVFVQAPWVRASPFSSVLFTFVLMALGLRLGGSRGQLLIGFCGSWIAGSLFWGWLRLHPLWHLPVEAFLLPLAIAGLGGPWRRAGQFYLAALIGTACTDAATALCGLMPLWPQVLQATPAEAPLLLSQAAQHVLEPLHLAIVLTMAVTLAGLSRWLWQRGEGGQVMASTLLSTLAVDGVFLLLALVAPHLSGLV